MTPQALDSNSTHEFALASGEGCSRTRSIPWNTALFCGLIIATLIPLWACAHFPSQDGPSHAYAAVVEHDYNRPDRPKFREFFVLNDRIVPNWICPHLLPLLAGAFSAEAAVKIILSAYLIVLPISVRYALRSIRRRAADLAIAIFPFVPNFYYHEGFLDFCVAIPVFFIVIGYWFNHRRYWKPRHTLVLAILLFICFLCHLVPTVLAGLFLVVLALLAGGGSMRDRLRRLAPVILAGLPVALLTLWFMLDQKGESVVSGYPYPTHLARLRELFRFQKAFASWESILAAANLCLFAGVSAWLLWRRRGRRLIIGADALLLLAGLCAAAFMLAPDAGAGGSLLVVRLAMPPFLALLLWWGAQPIGSAAFARLRLACTAVSTPVTILLLISTAISYHKFAPYFLDMNAAVAHIEPNSTLMYTSLSSNQTLGPDGRLLSHGPDIFMHDACQQAGQRGIAIVNSMIAITSYQGIQYRPNLNPGTDDLIEFTAHANRIGKPIDYVLVWTGGAIPDNANTRRIYQQLNDQYELVYVSPATGYARLYRHKRSVLISSN
jgi:hypothetical protein